jgi:hypothetical protein
VLAIAACYGTFALIGALSLMGITLAPQVGAWAGAISLLALLAAVSVLLATGTIVRRPAHDRPLGAALVLSVMLVRYDWLMELAGFAALVVAGVWDWRLQRATRSQEN